MTKEQLFKECNIDESHSEWQNGFDNWISVEIYRAMHYGELPDSEYTSVRYIYDFNRNAKQHITNPYFGSMFLTSKRLIYRHWESIIDELSK